MVEPDRTSLASAGVTARILSAWGCWSASVSFDSGLIVTVRPATTLTASGRATGTWFAGTAAVVGSVGDARPVVGLLVGSVVGWVVGWVVGPAVGSALVVP